MIINDVFLKVYINGTIVYISSWNLPLPFNIMFG